MRWMQIGRPLPPALRSAYRYFTAVLLFRPTDDMLRTVQVLRLNSRHFHAWILTSNPPWYADNLLLRGQKWPQSNQNLSVAKQELDINVKACDENRGRSVAPSIWSTRPSVGGTISQVRKVESNIEPARPSDIHPMHALIHHRGGQPSKPLVHTSQKRNLLIWIFLETLFRAWEGQ